jgi:hypothetical protein
LIKIDYLIIKNILTSRMIAFWQRQENTVWMATLLKSVTSKEWADTSFEKVRPLTFLKVRYTTHSQRHMYDWEDRCGVVLSLNRTKDGDVYSITLLLVSNYEQVEIPYEREEDPESMGGYTNDHTTHLQTLE